MMKGIVHIRERMTSHFISFCPHIHTERNNLRPKWSYSVGMWTTMMFFVFARCEDKGPYWRKPIDANHGELITPLREGKRPG